MAFLGGLDPDREHNKWCPFNRAQVREHDPRAFDMLCRVWGVEIDDEEEQHDAGGDESGGGVRLSPGGGGVLDNDGDDRVPTRESRGDRGEKKDRMLCCVQPVGLERIYPKLTSH